MHHQLIQFSYAMWIYFSGGGISSCERHFEHYVEGSACITYFKDLMLTNSNIKNALDCCVGAICWYLLGFGFAYGDRDDNGFIGSQYFAFDKVNDSDTVSPAICTPYT